MPWFARARWASCLDFISSISFCIFHIFKEGISIAGSHSKHALTVSLDVWWWNLPDFFLSNFYPNFRRTNYIDFVISPGTLFHYISFFHWDFSNLRF